MTAIQICSLFSSLSFFGYVIAYFVGPQMKLEFKRFNLQKIGGYIVVLEFLGALGLIVGLKFNLILIVSSLGLALLMLAGVVVRVRLKDGLLVSFPAFFFMVLNAFIFVAAISFY
ncbi:MAG: hypothetical protein CMD20_03610 [Flavobacteriales bacterium]|nr:hypothetical protein [Flavobacteriales bacterium]|tara:strand:+ start:1883 stop:2227 length:345 start_codon:yes stop_codon:yes gene_type:complete